MPEKRATILFLVSGFFWLCFPGGELAAGELISPVLQAHPALEKQIQKWIDDLSKTQEHAQKAQELLLKIDRVASPYLFQALEESRPAQVKRRIILVLRQMRPSGVQQALWATLNHQNETMRVREEAALALGDFQDNDYLAKLRKYSFHRDSHLARAASYALLQYQHWQVIPHLIALLKHRDREIVRKAQQKLMELTNNNHIQTYEGWQQWWAKQQDIFRDTK